MQTTENSAHAKIAGGLILKRMMVKTAESAAPPPSKKLWCRSAVLWFQRSKSPFWGLRTINFDENVIEPPKIAAELGKGALFPNISPVSDKISNLWKPLAR